MKASKRFPKPVPPNAMSYQIELRDGAWRRTRTVVVSAGSGHQEERRSILAGTGAAR